jgi:hypothetical protein
MTRARKKRGTSIGLEVLVAMVLCLALGKRATAETPVEDGVPKGTVAFFSFDGTGGNCPAGWVAATQVQGRMVVGVTEPDQVGVLVGTPLTDQEDRTHIHPFEGTVHLPSKNIAGADGGNHNGAQSGDHVVSGNSENAGSGLPFVQLLVCEKS